MGAHLWSRFLLAAQGGPRPSGGARAELRQHGPAPGAGADTPQRPAVGPSAKLPLSAGAKQLTQALRASPDEVLTDNSRASRPSSLLSGGAHSCFLRCPDASVAGVPATSLPWHSVPAPSTCQGGWRSVGSAPPAKLTVARLPGSRPVPASALVTPLSHMRRQRPPSPSEHSGGRQDRKPRSWLTPSVQQPQPPSLQQPAPGPRGASASRVALPPRPTPPDRHASSLWTAWTGPGC